jgi:hypothetical protein
MAGTIIADFIRTDANRLSLNVGNTTFATINSSGFFSNTGTQLIAANGAISGASVIAGSIPTGAIADNAITSAKISTAANTIPRSAMTTGSVLQVVPFTTQTPFSTTSGSATSTGFAQSITPSSASSKVLVIAYSTLGVPATGMNGHINLLRNNVTTLATDWYVTYGAASYLNAGFTAVYLDSPATTSSTTYTLYAYRDGAAGTIYVGARQDGGSPVVTSITLMEIAA